DFMFFFFSSRRRHTRFSRDWSSDVCSSDLGHAHRPGIWRRHGRVLINTGSFSLPGRPRGVLIDSEKLSVRTIERRAGQYHLAPRSEERRVGKEWRTRWAAHPQHNKVTTNGN